MVNKLTIQSIFIFSSPEPKAQLSIFDQNLSVAPLSVVFGVGGVVVVVNFSHFNLLQNHCTDFNQTWHKASLDEGDSSLFK